MWEAWTNTNSTFLRFTHVFFCRIMHTKQICSQESIGALYWYHRLTLHWHFAWHSIDTWLTCRSRIDIFNQCIWVGEHSADYWPNVDRVSVKCHLISIPLCMFCLIVTCDVHCKQHKLSRWALFALTANVVKIKKSVNWVLTEGWLGCRLLVDGHIDWGTIKGINWHLTTIPSIHMTIPAYSCVKYNVSCSI